MMATSALAQNSEFFFIFPQGSDPAGFTGRLQVDANGGDQICVDFGIRSPTAPHKALSGVVGEAVATLSGGCTIECTSPAPKIDKTDPNFLGVDAGASILTPQAVCQGAPPTVPFAAAAVGAASDNMLISATGNYWGEICYNVAADTCGTCAIDWLAPCMENQNGNCDSALTGANTGSLPVAADYSGLDIFVGQPNDDCAGAGAAANGFNVTAATPYDLTCATLDGDAAGCGGGDAADVWFSTTASCTGEMSVTVTGAGHNVTVYNEGVGCTPGLADELGCNPGPIAAVSNGDTYLIKVSGPVGESGDVEILCDQACTPGQQAGSALTLSECGAAAECFLPFCDAALGCVEVADPSLATSCDDGITCTINDHCDGAGACVGGGPLDCDDDAVCTFDECLEPGETNVVGTVSAGGCSNVDINSVPCTDIADCPAGAATCSSDGDGTCDCVSSPDLCIVASAAPGPASGTCYDEGSDVIVEVVMGFSTQPICTAQFFLQYDAAGLDFQSITPGGGVFTNVVSSSVDEVAGTIDYAVGPAPGQICLGTQGPAVVATIVFTPLTDCKVDEVCFRPHNPATKLGADDGSTVCPAGHDGPACHILTAPCCSGAFNFDSTPPVVVGCPDSVSGPADCGGLTKNVTFTLPSVATDNCDGDVALNCTISHSEGANVDQLLPNGGDFPVGTTTISCNGTTDSCGNASDDCEFSVTNSGQNELWVELELSPTMKQGGLNGVIRGINLSITDCGSVANPETVEVCDDVSFGGVYNLAGHGHAHVKVPAANYYCIQAWDSLHTLKAACDVTCEVMNGDSVWFAAFKGSKDLNSACHWLVNGNLNGDPVIDVIDYAEYLACIAGNALPGADTPCAYDEEVNGNHCDINGDGIVSLADFSFIVVNFFNNDKAGCEVVCNPAAASPAPVTPVGSISIRDLDEGLRRTARMGDMNHDGVLDMTDISLYANSGGVTSEREDRPSVRDNDRDVKDSSTSLRGRR
jgi:hypothetical protein